MALGLTAWPRWTFEWARSFDAIEEAGLEDYTIVIFRPGRCYPEGCILTSNRFYMIAVGGAGSSGLPAFANGTRTSTNAISAITTTPARYEGC
jgi:hypothetical protein